LQTPTNSLQYQIEKKLISIVGWFFSLMALAVLVIAVLSLNIYSVSKLERAQEHVSGKNIQAHAQRLNTIHEKLTQALKQGLIVPYYQPCVELTTGRIVGCVALARS